MDALIRIVLGAIIIASVVVMIYRLKKWVNSLLNKQFAKRYKREIKTNRKIKADDDLLISQFTAQLSIANKEIESDKKLIKNLATQLTKAQELVQRYEVIVNAK